MAADLGSPRFRVSPKRFNLDDGLGHHHPPEGTRFRQGNALGVLVELILQKCQDPLDGGAVQNRVIIG
jgi:hypothetical protein